MEPLNKKQRQAASDRVTADFRERCRGFDPPRQAVLEASAERTSKCGKCQGEVRAVMQGASKSDGYMSDLDIKITLFCRVAECGWTVTQWRPWSKSKPKEIEHAECDDAGGSQA